MSTHSLCSRAKIMYRVYALVKPSVTIKSGVPWGLVYMGMLA